MKTWKYAELFAYYFRKWLSEEEFLEYELSRAEIWLNNYQNVHTWEI
jgi:hypothetical protein